MIADEAAQGEAAPAVVSSQQLTELASAAGQSTSQVVSQIQSSLEGQGLGAAYTDPSADLLPVMPYALGAGTALLGIGLFAGAYALLRQKPRREEHGHRHHNSHVHQSQAESFAVPVIQAVAPDDTAAFLAILNNDSDGQPAQAPVPHRSVQAARELDREHSAHLKPAAAPVASNLDDLDDLERLALGYVGTGASGFVPLDAADNTASRVESSIPRRPAFSYEAALVELSSDDRKPSGTDEPDPDDGPKGGPSAPACSYDVASAYSKTQLTQPIGRVCASQSADDFAATARILASGTGKVHRVTTPSSHLDFSGMDVIDANATSYRNAPAANPMVEYDDWRGVALSELTGEGRRGDSAPDISTDGYVSLIETKSQPARPSKRRNFVAPVIGPGVDREAAIKRQEMMRASSSPAAAMLVDRDNEFIARRSQSQAQGQQFRAPQQSQAQPQPRPFAPAKPASKNRSSAPHVDVAAGGVPVIPRGRAQAEPMGRPGPAAGSSSVMGRVNVDVQTSGIPSASSFVPPQPPVQASVISDRSLSAAVAAASSAYAAFNTYSAPASSPAVSSCDEGASRAASYAAAVYGNPEQPYRSQVASSPRAPEVGTVLSEGVQAASTFSQSGVSGSYIDYMVQDEFEHRHDSLAQRNAALGRMQVINGSATSPVSVRDSIKRHRA